MSASTTERAAPALSVRDLRVHLATESGEVTAVQGVSFDVRAGETVCVVASGGNVDLARLPELLALAG